MVEIIVSVITSVFTFVGVLITVIYGNKKTAKQNDLTLYRIDQLEKKQDKHNNLIDRMYDVEEQIDLLKASQKVSNHRIDDLELFHKPH